MTDIGAKSWDRPARSLPINPAYLILALLPLVYPHLVTPFFIVQVGAQTLYLGVIALSLMFLAGYGGMVSLSQMTVAGFAGYMVAIFGTNGQNLGLNWPWEVYLPLAILLAVVMATLIGLISVRTSGIYTIMITLAIGVAFFYFTRQNYAIFNGFSGFAGLHPPVVFGIDLRAPLPFYYLCLAIAVLSYIAVVYLSRSTFGIALQAIRDNPRRMNALGYHVTAHRVAAHALAGLIAALGGIPLVWLNGRVSPGTIDVGPTINILVIAVLGGLRRPIGPFIGALVFVLLQNFAIDLVGQERFNTIIGLVFLLIVLVSPDGLLGLWQKLGDAARRRATTAGEDSWRKS